MLVANTPRSYQCNGTGAQKFAIQRGDGKFQVAGTNFCVDAGVNPGNGSKLHLWQCYQGLPQQQWYWTNDNRIALTGQGECATTMPRSGVVGRRMARLPSDPPRVPH